MATGVANYLQMADWTLNGTIEGPSVSADGRLGVGVTAPTQALEVAGSAVVAGTLSAGNPITFKNAVINGDMRINQRGISTNMTFLTVVGATNIYSVDRWNIFRGALQTGACAGQGALASSDAPYLQGLRNFLRVSRVNGDTGIQPVTCAHQLESRESFRFAGQPATFSFWYRTGSGFSGTLQINFFSGTGTDEAWRNGVTGSYTISGQTLVSSNAWQFVAVTGFVPLSATQLFCGLSSSASGTAGGFDYFDVTGVQLEKGSVATPYEIRPFATELALCQRYFQISGPYASAVGGIAYLNYALATTVKFPVTMRAIPTFTLVGGTFRNSATGVYSTVATPTVLMGTTGFSVIYDFNGAPGISPVLTVGNAYDYNYTVSAEL
jgi:hypothetical protein